jgi:hypothetical protein
LGGIGWPSSKAEDVSASFVGLDGVDVVMAETSGLVIGVPDAASLGGEVDADWPAEPVVDPDPPHPSGRIASATTDIANQEARRTSRSPASSIPGEDAPVERGSQPTV